MDPSKSSAPPAGWSDEKTSMGHAPPPPYQDHPYPGNPQPGLAYPQQQQGYVPLPQYGGAGYGQQPYPGQQYPGQQFPGQQFPGQQFPGQQPIVTVQPTVYVTRGPLLNPVNDYLGYSIFTMLCCCFPLGIAALIYSISARDSNHIGDQAGAERNSRKARILNHVGLGLGIGIIIVYITMVATMTSIQ